MRARSDEPATQSSALYFVNTIGAAVGSLLAGFVLIPSIGMSGTIYVAMAGTTIAALCVAAVRGSSDDAGESHDPGRQRQDAAATSLSGERARSLRRRRGWPMAVLGLSGFAALVHEIAWTRILSLVLGPTTYAFAATLAAVIAGVAIGSGVGTWLVSTRASKAAGMLAFTLSLAAVTASWTYAAAGARIPMMVARHVADFADFDQLLRARRAVDDGVDPADVGLSRRRVSVGAGARRRSPACRAGPFRPRLRDQHARLGRRARSRPGSSSFPPSDSADAVDRQRLPDRLHGRADSARAR